MIKRIFLAAAVLCAGIAASAADLLTGLQTEYQTDPVGIEVAQPRFGWRMSSARKGAAQNAYQISVRDRNGKEVWNSGKVQSGNSVAVPYEGQKLAMNHNYSWSVKTWDEKGRALEGPEAHFTTGLMGSGWNGARWIGSSQPHFSKYRSVFDLSYTFTGTESEFIINRIDASNFISVAVRGGELVVSHTKDGVSSCDGSVPLKILSSGRNRVWLAFRAERYRRGTVLTVKVNGQKGLWRVLSGGDNGEWNYLLNKRSSEYHRYAAVKVNDMPGLLIFPDEFTWPSGAGAEPTNFDVASSNWNGVNYQDAAFLTLQAAGCVFLPAAGYRNGNYGNASIDDAGSLGYYWSASPHYDYDAYDLFFSSRFVSPRNFDARYRAQSVRLVTESN